MEKASPLKRILSVQKFIAYDTQGQFPLASELWKMTHHHKRNNYFFPMLVKSQVINC